MRLIKPECVSAKTPHTKNAAIRLPYQYRNDKKKIMQFIGVRVHKMFGRVLTTIQGNSRQWNK